MFRPDTDEEMNPLDPMTRTASPVNLRSYLEDLYKKKNLGDDQRMKLEQGVAESKPGAGLTFLASLGAGLAGQNQASAVDALGQSSRDKQKELDAFDAKRKGAFDELKADREIGKFEREQSDEMELRDPESEKSKLMQQAASRMFQGKDFSGYSAKDLESIRSSLETVSKLEMESARRKEDVDDRRATSARDFAFKEKELAAKIAEDKAKREKPGKGFVSPISGELLTPGQKKVDEKYAQDYVDFTSKGRNNAANAIKKMEDLAAEMEADKGLIEMGGGGRFSSVLPDVMRSRDSIRRRDEARNYANTTLKELFGGQLSDAERRAAAQEYYNDKLDNPENAAILRRKIQELKDNLESQTAQAKHYEQYGTLEGFKGISGPQKTPPGKVRVTNGTETLEIDESDLEDAQKDGFKIAG